MNKINILKFLLVITIFIWACSCYTKKEVGLPVWAIGPFERPVAVNPIISPSNQTFYCPMQHDSVGWEENDTFNPAAVLLNDTICVLYRAEDKSGEGIGKRTSRIGLAKSKDGFTMTFRNKPVLYPEEDKFKEIEWPGGCEDPRVAKTKNGLYVMFYTAWNRNVPRLAVATSKDLVSWEKHGLAFEKAYEGRFNGLACKSASIVTKDIGGELIVDKIKGKYFMYWGETAICAATSDNLIDWKPILNEKGEIRELVKPRNGYFDSKLTECGPPALLTEEGIVLLYNGKNGGLNEGDPNYPEGAYCAGQLLFSSQNPYELLERLDKPFFVPQESFEKSGQYVDGTVFIEGLVLKDDVYYLYYGCADSKVAVAVCNTKIRE